MGQTANSCCVVDVTRPFHSPALPDGYREANTDREHNNEPPGVGGRETSRAPA